MNNTQGRFHLIIRVSHRASDGSLPDALIDQFVIEAEVPASLNKEPNVQGVIVRGENSASSSLNVTLTVRCEENFFGAGCEKLCRKDGTHCRIGMH